MIPLYAITTEVLAGLRDKYKRRVKASNKPADWVLSGDDGAGAISDLLDAEIWFRNCPQAFPVYGTLRKCIYVDLRKLEDGIY